jgi:hypothetical protein
MSPRTIAPLLVVSLAMAAVAILEHARTIPGFESGIAIRWGAILACPVMAIFGWLLKDRRGLRHILVPVLCGIVAAPTAGTLLASIAGKALPPLEKNLMQGIEGLIVASCLFLTTEIQRRRLVAVCGIMGIMGFAAIPEISSEPIRAMIWLSLALPVWLFMEHQAGLPTNQKLAENTVEFTSGRLRIRGLIIRSSLLTIVAFIVISQCKGDRAIHRVFAEWVGSSGGSGETNELATSGVGDGPNEVAASENADSVGFTDSDIYLESERPSLFDAFNEQYGEPYKPRKQERMQAMGPQNVKETGGKPKENLQAGRTFEMQRKQAGSARKPEDRPARALAYVKGRPGARLKLATFDRFDGSSWTLEADCPESCSLRVLDSGRGDCWFCLNTPRAELFPESVEHKIKVAAIDTSVVPAPANLERYRVGGLREPSMFGWAGRGVVRMAGRTIPAGTSIDAVSRRVSRRHLHETAFDGSHGHSVHHHHFRESGDYELSKASRDIIECWNLGETRSWPQVERLIACLRDHSKPTNDRISTEVFSTIKPASLIESSEDSVEQFLVHRRPGPDYQFATAAAVILRELGYPCRLASGLYVDPESYDASKSHYVLDSRHLHFWVELLTPQNVWVPIEPTPGYVDEFAHETWGDLLAIQFYRLWYWAQRHRLPLGLTIAAILTVLVFRARLYDLAMSQYLARFAHLNERKHAIRTVRHLEWRLAKIMGRRPPQRSLRNHWDRLKGSPDDLSTLLRVCEWAAYAPVDRPPPCPAETIRRLCTTAARDWKRNEMRLWNLQGIESK